MRALIKEQVAKAGEDEVSPALEGALEALELARWDDLPEATLPWDRVTELAGQQGIGEADVVWDLTRGHGHRQRPAPSAVDEEALARLAAELALRDELAQAVRHLRPDRLADGRRHVEAHEVEQGERAERMPGAELHAGVHASASRPPRSSSRTASNR